MKRKDTEDSTEGLLSERLKTLKTRPEMHKETYDWNRNKLKHFPLKSETFATYVASATPLKQPHIQDASVILRHLVLKSFICKF